jgi:glycerophosphoryl diester phosphodiesterase
VTQLWRCTICDYITEGDEPPDICPVCGATRDYFVPYQEPTTRRPLVVAHRGASSDAPENTLASFNLAWEQDADAIEADFHLTRDGKLACIHDPDTKRVAAKALVVANATLDELRELDIGAWKDEAWRGEAMPTFAEVVATVPLGKRIYIEIKSKCEILPAMGEALANCPLAPTQITLISFHEDVLKEAAKSLPGYRKLLLLDTKKTTPTAKAILDRLDHCRADGIDFKLKPWMTRPFVDAIHAEGKEFHLWTLDTPEDAAHALLLRADSLTTNRPGWLREYVAEASRDHK